MANSRIATSSITQGFPKSKSLLTGNDAIYAGSYESIATINIGSGGASGMSFTSIPQTYKHLQLRITGKSNTAGGPAIFFNGVSTGTSYSSHYLIGTGSVAQSSAATSQPYVGSATTTSSAQFGGYIFDLLDYTDTNKNKTFRMLSGYDENGSGNIYLSSGLWMNTAAVNSIDFFNGYVWSQYTTASLYGIK